MGLHGYDIIAHSDGEIVSRTRKCLRAQTLNPNWRGVGRTHFTKWPTNGPSLQEEGQGKGKGC
jgi:hypothetical protein